MLSCTLGLTGPSGVGKDTIAHYLHDHHEFLHAKMAIPLRAYVYAKHNLPPSRMGDKTFEQGAVQRGLLAEGARLRDVYGPHIFTSGLIHTLRCSGLHAAHMVVSDIRQESEAEYIDARGGVLLRLTRDTTARPVQPLDSVLSKLNLPTVHLTEGEWSTHHTVVHRILPLCTVAPVKRNHPNGMFLPWYTLLGDTAPALHILTTQYATEYIERLNPNLEPTWENS